MQCATRAPFVVPHGDPPPTALNDPPLLEPSLHSSQRRSYPVLRSPWSIAAVLGSLLVTASCGGEDGGPRIDPDVATEVTVSPASPSLADCATTPLTVVAINGNGDIIASPSITWTALDPGIATVSPGGVVTGQGAGIGRIKAQSGAVADTASVTVTAVPPTFGIGPDTVIVLTGTTYPIQALTNCHGAALPSVGVTYVPVDSSVATVNTTGVVTPVKLGRTKIVASMAGGAADTIVIAVGRAYSFTLDTTVTGGGRYYGVAVSAPGGFAYANRPDANYVGRYDLLARTLDLTAAAVGGQATGLSIDPAGTRAWVASQTSTRVDRIDATTNTPLGTTSLGFNPYWTVTSPTGGTVYVSGNGGRIQFLSGTTGASVDSVLVDQDPFGLALTPNGATLFVGHLSAATVRRVNTATKATSVFKTFGSSVNGLAVSPNGQILAVASENTDSLYFLQVSDGTSVGQVAIPNAWGVAFTPNGSEVWVTSLSGSVYRVNATSHAVTDSIAVGGTPRGIAIHPLGWGAVIGNENGSLHIIR